MVLVHCESRVLWTSWGMSCRHADSARWIETPGRHQSAKGLKLGSPLIDLWILAQQQDT